MKISTISTWLGAAVIVVASYVPGIAQTPEPSSTPAATGGDSTSWLQAINAGRETPVLAEKIRFRKLDWGSAVVVGFLLDNRNILVGSVILGGRVLTPRQASLEMMTQAGFDKAEPKERKALAQRFLEQVFMSFGEEILTQAPPNFPTEKGKKSHFTAPIVQVDGAGGVTITLWIQEIGAGRTIVKFRRTQYYFTSRGELESSRVIENAETEI